MNQELTLKPAWNASKNPDDGIWHDSKVDPMSHVPHVPHKMESGDSSVTMDLLVHSLLALGTTRKELAKIMGDHI